MLQRICVYCGSSPGNDEIYTRAAQDLANVLVQNKIELVYGGATKGAMGILADAVLEQGGAVHGLNYIIKKICHDDRVLIVDDVFDTGNTIKAVIDELGHRARGNTPEDIRIAVPWYKPERNETDIVPDYFVRETAEWLVFPHELDALSPEELRQERPEIAAIIEGARERRQPA